MRKIEWTRCAFVLLLLAIAPGLAVAEKFALVNAKENLTLRTDTSLTARRIETLLRLQPVEVLERKTVKERVWARVRTVKAAKGKSNTGWVLSDYLSKTAFATAKADKTNVRRGPGTEYDVIMHYAKNYPVQVLDVATNGWAKVRDVDGDMGWLHPNMLEIEPVYVITSGPYKIFNIRAGVGTENPIKFSAEKGYLMEVLEEKDGWLNVKDRDGDEGWISAKIVFGWRDMEYPKPE